MAQDLQTRVDQMFAKDRLWAWAFVIVLWATLIFVYFMTIPHINDGATKVVAGVAAFILGILNTASIAAMVSHYAHDKKFIYELDIKHLDEMAQSRER